MEKKTEYGQEIKHTMASIDLDWLDESELSLSLKLLEKNGFDQNVWFDLSPGGKGYHIQTWCKPKDGLTFRQLLCLRRICHDDFYRVKLDAMGERQIGVLFDWKEKTIEKRGK